MEKWQETHIRNNLGKLIEITVCNAQLMSELTDYLSKYDESALDAKLQTNGKIAQSKLLYDIAVTKHGIYEALTMALLKSKQSGAFQIFLQGALLHNRDGNLGISGISQQLLEKALSGFGRHALECFASFQGHDMRLRDALQNLTDEVVESLTSKYMKGNLLAELINNKRPILINNTIPDSINYYICRRLTSRHKLDPAVFDTSCNDVFVIKRIQLHELSSLARHQGTDLSTNQLEKLTVRFIVLEYEKDYNEICKLTSEPVHLLDYVETRFTWIKSHGDISTLQNFVSKDQDGQMEDGFISSCFETSNPVCISDTPGMGKTELLINLGNTIKQLHPQRNVRYIVLRELVPEVQQKCHDTINEDFLINLISEQASKYKFGREMLKELLRSKTPVVDLIFDGFDEVLFNQVSTAKSILRTFAQLTSVRLYVATRPHMRDELEKSLCVLGYNLEAFGDDEQIECLIKYWKQHDPSSNDCRLEEFARHCLLTLQENMKDSERGIAGIPLQCKMLAEVYQDDAIKYSKPKNRLTDLDTGVVIRMKSIFDVYQRLVELRFNKMSKTAEDHPNEKMELLTFAHMNAALQLLFPECDLKLNVHFTGDCEVEARQLCELGILERKDTAMSTPRFIHRTFAEYFLGLLVVRLLHSHEEFGLQDSKRNKFILFFYNTILQTTPSKENPLGFCKFGKWDAICTSSFQYSVVCYFINEHLKRSQHSDVGKVPWTKDAFQLYNVLAACIVHDYSALFFLTKEEPTINTDLLLQNFQVSSLTMLAAKYSSLELFKLTYQHLTNYFKNYQKPNFITCTSPDFYITPLHVAVARGNFPISEFMVKYFKSDNTLHELNLVVHCCVSGSIKDNDSKISLKKQIIKLILNFCPKWINESMLDGTTPLLQSGVHLKIIKVLLNCGADVNKVGMNGCLLHRIVDTDITNQKYYEIVLLCLKFKFNQFNCYDKKRRAPLHVALQKLELLNETVELFHLKKADFNAADEMGDTVFFYAVRANRTVTLLRTLLSFGCDIKKKNHNHDHLFHICARHGNFRAFEYFLNSNKFEKDSIVAINKQEMTPFTQGLLIGKGLTVSILKKMEKKGFMLTSDLASSGLKGLLCNKHIMAWELNVEFIRLADYLLEKGALVRCRNAGSPWNLEATLKNISNITATIHCNSKLLTELLRRGVNGIDVLNDNSGEARPNEESMLFFDNKTVDVLSDNIEVSQWLQSFRFVQHALFTQDGSFERLCVSLIAADQTQPFVLLKQCLKSDLQESIKFVTPINGINSFMQSKQDQMVLLQSRSIELTISRLRNTLDPDLPVIIEEDLSKEILDSTPAIYQCESISYEILEAIGRLERKVICVCLTVNEELRKFNNFITQSDETTWEDLSTDFQSKLTLHANVASEISDLPLVDRFLLKNDELVDFIRENDHSRDEVLAIITDHVDEYLLNSSFTSPKIPEFEITALHVAVQRGHPAITEFLLSLKQHAELKNLKYLLHFCVAGSETDAEKTLSRKESIIELISHKNNSWVSEPLPNGTPPLLQRKVHARLIERLIKCGADKAMALKFGKGLTVQIVQIMEEHGLMLTKQLSSETLRGIICSNQIMSWELNHSFIQLVDYLIMKGGRLLCKNGKSPWEMKTIQKNTVRILESIDDNDCFVRELSTRRANELKRSAQSDRMLEKWEALQHKSSFECLCVSLIACNQIESYNFIKQCLQSVLNYSPKFVTQLFGIQHFIAAKTYTVAVLKSWNIELSITRILETVDSDVVVIQEKDLGTLQGRTHPVILQCNVATVEVAEKLIRLNHMIICVCSDVDTELVKLKICEVLKDEFSWEDLTTEYQNELGIKMESVKKMELVRNELEETHEMNLAHGNLPMKIVELEKLCSSEYCSSTIKVIDNATNAYIKSIPTFLSSLIPKILPSSCHVAVERGHIGTLDFILSLQDFDTQNLKYMMHCCVAGSVTDNSATISNKLKIIDLLTRKKLQWLNETLPNGTTPILQSNIHVKLFECLVNLGADIDVGDKTGIPPIINALCLLKEVNVPLIRLMEERGLNISKNIASEILSALFCQNNTHLLNPDSNFVDVADYLISKGGVLTLKNNKSPWYSVELQKNLPEIIQMTRSNKNLMKELHKREIAPAGQMDIMVENLELLYSTLQSTQYNNSFEKMCLCLISCNQIKPFNLMRQCFRSAKIDTVLFVSPPTGIMGFVESKHQLVTVLISKNFDVTVERIKETIHGDILLVDDTALNKDVPNAHLALYRCNTATGKEMKSLATQRCKTICICKNIDDELDKNIVHEDNVTWEDLSLVLQNYLLGFEVGHCIKRVSHLKEKELMELKIVLSSMPEFAGFKRKECIIEDKNLSPDPLYYSTNEDLVFRRITHANTEVYPNEEDRDDKTCDNFPLCTCGEHPVGSENLIWSVFRYSGTHLTCWINVLEVVKQMKSKAAFKLGKSEITKLFDCVCNGRNNLEYLRQIKKSNVGKFLRLHSVDTTTVIIDLLKYFKCVDEERQDLQLLAVKTFFPKTKIFINVPKVEKYVELGILKFRKASLMFQYKVIAFYFLADFLSSMQTSRLANLLRKQILNDCFEPHQVQIKFQATNMRSIAPFRKTIKTFRFFNANFFQFLDRLLNLNANVLSDWLKVKKSKGFPMKWLNACIVGNHFVLLSLFLPFAVKNKVFQSSELLSLSIMYADVSIIDLVLAKFPKKSNKNIIDIQLENDGIELTNISILHIAALRGNYLVMHDLLINKKFKDELCRPIMRNILAYCVFDTQHKSEQVFDRKRIIKCLLESDVSLINETWMSPLLVENIHVDLIIYLISLGVDVNTVNADSKNLLHVCPEYMTPEEYHEVVQTLHDRGDDNIFHTKDVLHRSPLHYAVKHLEVLDSTLELFSTARVDFSETDSDEGTALIWAVFYNKSLRLLQALVHYGADIHQRENNHTVLHMAANIGNLKALRYFVSCGCDVNAKDKDGNTPLFLPFNYFIAQDRIHDVVQLLIRHGADVNIINKKQKTPLSKAIQLKGRLWNRTVEFLRKAGSLK